MVNNIRNNTISGIDAKKDLNTLNDIKKCRNKELLNIFNDLLGIILTEKTERIESESQEDKNENGNENYENENPKNKKNSTNN